MIPRLDCIVKDFDDISTGLWRMKKKKACQNAEAGTPCLLRGCCMAPPLADQKKKKKKKKKKLFLWFRPESNWSLGQMDI